MPPPGGGPAYSVENRPIAATAAISCYKLVLNKNKAIALFALNFSTVVSPCNKRFLVWPLVRLFKQARIPLPGVVTLILVLDFACREQKQGFSTACVLVF